MGYMVPARPSRSNAVPSVSFPSGLTDDEIDGMAAVPVGRIVLMTIAVVAFILLKALA
jgi:hypothetical protein